MYNFLACSLVAVPLVQFETSNDLKELECRCLVQNAVGIKNGMRREDAERTLQATSIGLPIVNGRWDVEEYYTSKLIPGRFIFVEYREYGNCYRVLNWHLADPAMTLPTFPLSPSPKWIATNVSQP